MQNTLQNTLKLQEISTAVNKDQSSVIGSYTNKY